MIERIFISSDEQKKLIVLPARNKNFLGAGLYLRYEDNPSDAWFVGFQLIGEIPLKYSSDEGLLGFEEPKYSDKMISNLADYLKRHCAKKNPYHGIIGIGIRAESLLNTEFRGFVPDELVGFLRLVQYIRKEQKDYLYMLVGYKKEGTKITTARLVPKKEKLEIKLMSGQPVVDYENKDWFDNEWNSAKDSGLMLE